VAVRDALGEVVAASFEPYFGDVPEEVDVDLFYAPLTFAEVDMSCEPVPYEDPNCGAGFIVDHCPSDRTRLAIDFALGADDVRLWSDTVGELGPLRVRAHAELWDPQLDMGPCRFERPTTSLSWAAVRPAP
jgi:hypothetical protein